MALNEIWSFAMSLPLLALVQPDEPESLKIDRLHSVATRLANMLRRGHHVRRQDLKRLMEEAFHASDATDSWSMRDAYDALEAAQVLLLRSPDMPAFLDLGGDAAFSCLARFENSLPTQTYRSEHQVEMQQFSTPISLAWFAATAARITPEDHVLEPSAGTGMLAVHALRAGASMSLNERDPGRALLLGKLLGQPVSSHDAEYIHDHLSIDVRPTIILINPPFSRSEGRGQDRFAGARHLRSALLRLVPGGRCVAIMSPSFAADGSGAGGYAAVCEISLPRLEITIQGNPYAKHGTSIAVRLLIFDKGWSGTTERHVADNMEAAAAILRNAPPRFTPPDLPPPTSALVPLRRRLQVAASPASLFGGLGRRELAAPDRIAASGSEIAPVRYCVREEPLAPGEPVGIYSGWRLARISIEGAKPHPDALVESVAMASVVPPAPSYQPLLQARALEGLSEAQLESIIHAGEAHSRNLPGLFSPNPAGDRLVDDPAGQAYRTGYFIADGTGVGKGREAAACILDQWNRGHRRAIWISMSDLIEDARRDWSALGGLSIDIQPISAFPLGAPIAMESGIIFLTYAALRSARHDSASRLQQLLAWTGTEFEGIILFDESHAMAHAGGTETEFGKAQGSEQGLAGVRLQNALPRARVIYMSATGAAKPEHLSYAMRLGLWGPGTAFSSRDAFMAAMEEGGIAAMEVICRDLKAMGLYTARALSFAGVEYEPLEHRLTQEQIAIYDAYADAWAIIHRQLKDILSESGIIDKMSGKVQNARARGSALSAFESAKQRFFSALLVAMKMPTLIDEIEREIASGHAILVQLASTGEAILDRRLSELSPEERAALDLEVSPGKPSSTISKMPSRRGRCGPSRRAMARFDPSRCSTLPATPSIVRPRSLRGTR
ncbi:strawberry notch-like NTP hydrolase domain-containing protein [Sphingobium rhizovicinum]|uniref:Strawberry notch-like NTP hydrolase domain-containing protein n=1 Tax=Sphingobium rhizovicinum TaxID=432308 RepID=A0ABV7NK25_9SPHN